MVVDPVAELVKRPTPPEEEMLPLKTTQLTERPNHYTVIEAARAPEEKRRRAETARQRMSEIEIQRADAAQLAKELRRYAEAAQEVSKLFVGKKGAYVAPKIPW